jgi:Ni/Fe-hydrogenase subunit HybB-like protein
MYVAKQWDFERFILLEGGVYTKLFWIGQILIGGIIPLILLFMPRSQETQRICFCFMAPLLVIIGGLAQMYVTIIGGQAFPLTLFPGFIESSSFYDGNGIHAYAPSIWEAMLGFGGIAIAFMATIIAVHALKFMPQDDLHVLQGRRATD